MSSQSRKWLPSLFTCDVTPSHSQLPVGSHFGTQHNREGKCQSKWINSVMFRRRIYIRFLRLSNEDYWGLTGYSFEPEYSEQEMEMPNETVILKNGAIVDIAVRWESLKKTCVVSTTKLNWKFKGIKCPWRNYLAGYNNRKCQVRDIHW